LLKTSLHKQKLVVLLLPLVVALQQELELQLLVLPPLVV
jgi:hypothetical protein